MKQLGILGGMGPQASLRFCELLLKQSRERYGARCNADYPHFLMSNLPVPELIASRESEEKAVRLLVAEAKRLEFAGADFLVMTCNTMHLFLDRLLPHISIPFVSMIAVVVSRIITDAVRTVGIIGSITTMQSRLYVQPLAAAGVGVILPDVTDHDNIGRAIERVIAGCATSEDRAYIRNIACELQKRGAQAVILGCTELHFLLRPKDAPLPLYDSLQLLATAVCTMLFSEKSCRMP